MHFCSMVNNMCNRCKIQFIERRVLCEFYVCRVAEHTLLSKLNFTSGTQFMDPAVKTYQSSFLMMALSGPKHGVNHKCALVGFLYIYIYMYWKSVGFQDITAVTI
jgi:hypothetical protein